ncbi:MAG: [Oscillospiraceae bacterium]|nr:[FeFe] hydrogenase H-cluster radical SAM maturase HydE [Oscillospiraceae bacterium]
MTELIRKLSRDRRLTTAEYERLIRERTAESARELRRLADQTRRRVYGNRVLIRGAVELSSICKNDCLYCIQRRSNKNCDRYRLRPREIFDCFEEGYGLGHRSFLLRGGEDGFYNDDLLERLIRELKDHFPGCAVTLALGERSRESYERLFNAGADRYLMRHECADRGLYESLHPAEMSWENRMHCLNVMKEVGYQSGCGFIVGLPGQTAAHLAEDLNYIEEYEPQMVDISPFIPQPGTPFADAAPGDRELTEFLLSIIRLILPNVLLMAQDTDGILSGANVICQTLYPVDPSGEQLASLQRSLADIGFEGITDRGDWVDG